MAGDVHVSVYLVLTGYITDWIAIDMILSYGLILYLLFILVEKSLVEI